MSELKASLIITAYGLIFGLAYDVSGKFPIPENYKYLLYILIIVLIAFTLTSIFYAFKTYIPRINQKLKKSVFFFHDINFHYKEADVYSKELIKVMEDDKKLKENDPEKFVEMIDELQKVNLRKGYTPEESKDIIEEIFGFQER